MDLEHLRGLFVALPPTTGRFREEGPRRGEAGLRPPGRFFSQIRVASEGQLSDSAWLALLGEVGEGMGRETWMKPGVSWIPGIRALTKRGCFLGHPMPRWASV